MSSRSTTEGMSEDEPLLGKGERVVYVMPTDPFADSPGGDLRLLDVWQIVWRAKLLILLVASVFSAGAIAYALAATEWYRAEVVLAPGGEQSAPALGGQLGGLAALAGVSVSMDGGDSAEALAVLKSREFARSFVEEFGLLTVFFADKWDAQHERWRGTNSSNWPDVRDAVAYFHDKVLAVSEDRQRQVVKLGVAWTDPRAAAEWANVLASRINAKLREQALREAESNVAYLRAEMASTNVIILQESIARLVERELQKLMLAKGNEEFAFRVIDPAEIPKRKARPNRVLIVVAGTFLGGALGILAAFLMHAIRSERRLNHSESRNI